MTKNEILKEIEKLESSPYYYEYDRKVYITCDDGVLVVNAFDVNDNYIAQQETMPEKLTSDEAANWINYIQTCFDLIKCQNIVAENDLDEIAYKKINEYCDHETSYEELLKMYEDLLTEYNLL